MEDWQLLDDFVRGNSEKAFQDLVNRHIHLVHSVALRRVRSPELAEEVAQAVFILLARKAGGLQKNRTLAGWLYRTTRFVAARASRGEQRRRQREEEAFQMRQISSSDDAWRRLEPVLDEAIDQLGPVDRDAVLLRFFQEQPLQAVGAALGISEEAARKRVARSLEKLRLIFARRGFTITTAILAATLAKNSVDAAPASLAGEVASRAAAHATAAAGALPLLVNETIKAWRRASTRMAAGLGAAALVAALLVVNGLTAGRPLVAVTAMAPAAARSSPLMGSVDAPPPTAVAGAEAPVSAKNTFTFAFQALDAATGGGVAGAKVLALMATDPAHIELRTNLVTDAAGQCLIPLSSSNLMILAVGVVADGYLEKCVFLGGKEPIPSEYTLKLPHGSKIGGVVRDESGHPVAGASLHVSFYGTSDFQTREFQRERPGFPSEDLTLATTDLSGRWSFGSAPETGGGFSIEVKHSDYPTASFGFDQDGGGFVSNPGSLKLEDLHAGSAVIVLGSGLRLRGIVTDEQKRPVAGARVRFGAMIAVSSDPMARTGQDGSFLLGNLSPGPGYLTVTAEGLAPEQVQVTAGTNNSPAGIQLKPGGLLRLRVVDQNGGGIGKVRVVLESWRGSRALDWSGVTDDTGGIDWTSAPRDEVELYAGKQGFFNSRNNLMTADSSEHVVVLTNEMIVSGLVTDSETKQPIASFKAIPGSGPEYWERSNLARGANGRYQVAFDEYRTPFQVRFEADGYEPAISQPFNGIVPQAACDIGLKRLRAGSGVGGVALLPDGRPAVGARLALCTREKWVILGRAEFLTRGDPILVAADAQGRFSFPPEPAPRFVAAVQPSGFARIQVSGAERDISIRLQPWGRLEGSLKLRSGANAGRQISLLNLPDMKNPGDVRLDFNVFSTKTDGQGHFTFAQAPPGDFNLFLVRGPGLPLTHQTPVKIEPGAVLRVEIGESGRLGRLLSGRFVLSDASRVVDWPKQTQASLWTKLPPPPIPAGLRGREQIEWQAQFSQTAEGLARARVSRNLPLDIHPDGSFVIEDVPAGVYQLIATVFDAAVDLRRLDKARAIGRVNNKDVIVPDAGGGGGADKLDLGTVVIPVSAK